MKRLFTAVLVSLFVVVVYAQDTITIKTINYQSNTRDTVIEFPSGNDSYSKILMLYNMRCKGNLVSDGNDRNRGCGEWDYSCNTYITDSTKIDSLSSSTAEYQIAGFGTGDFNYSTTPSYNYHRISKTQTTVDSMRNQKTYHFGKGLAQTDLLNITEPSDNFGRSMMLITAAELTNAGMNAGNINALYFHNLSAGHPTDVSLVRMKQVNIDSFDHSNLALGGFTTVYSNDYQFVVDTNKLIFNTPFFWDGVSNIVVDFSFQSKVTNITTVDLKADVTPYRQFAQASTTNALYLDGNSYITVDGYKGIMGSTSRTIDAWIKTSTVNGEICSWGRNAAGEKWVFRVNDNGELRVEVNGGYTIGTTLLTDNRWHHVACVLNGNQVNQIDLYVDGQLEAVSSVSNRSINTTPDIDVRISRGVNNRYFKGLIDNVRLWDRALTGIEIARIMHSSLDDLPTTGLVFNFDFKAVSQYQTTDRTGNYTGTVRGSYYLERDRNYAINRDFTLSYIRPMFSLVDGDFYITNNTSAEFDSTAQAPTSIVHREVISQYNTIYDDIISPIDTTLGWDASNQHRYFDENGALYQETPVTSDASVSTGTLDYMRRWPSSFEIMSFVTPYGIGLNMGATGKTWTFDVTDFAPILKGKKRFYLTRGGEWQEEMDIQFLFIKGTPGREVLDIDQIWPTVQYKPGYQDIQSDRYFPPVEFMTRSDAKGFKIRSAITGHGQEGEFIPRDHTISMNDTTFQRTVWKACADNPVYPQGGTWIYDRAGWCPGMATDIAEYDITGKVDGGDAIALDYNVTSGSGSSNYIVNNQIVQYGDYNFELDADLIDIVEPSMKVEHARTNPMCISPKALVKNNGSTLMSFITIEYWVNDENNKRTFTWPCHLRPGEVESINFPVDNSVWSTAIEGNSIFTARITKVNGVEDEYAANNVYHSPFDFPNMYPQDFYLFFRPNNAANETGIRIVDEWGKEVYNRPQNSLNAGQLYRDTLRLGLGCYQLEISDSDDDGINFWANNDGAGFFRIVGIGTGTLLNLNGDFGKRSIVNFTIAHKLDIPEHKLGSRYECYPNPTTGEIWVEGEDMMDATLTVINAWGQQLELPVQMEGIRARINLAAQPSGIYFVMMEKDGSTWTTKVIKQ